MNYRIREFREALIALTNDYDDIPLEAKYMALQLVTNKVTEMANDAVLKEVEECKKRTVE